MPEVGAGLDPQPSLPALPQGGAVVLDGWYQGPGEPRVLLAGRPARILWAHQGHPAHPGCGFRGVVALPELEPGEHPVWLQRTDGSEQELGRIQVVEPLPGPGAPAGSAPAMAVCMATYRPDPRLLQRQLESIRRQTHQDWICLIQDDASPEADRRELQRLVARDPRFRVAVNPENLGFYANFEACLARVPEGARYVALADQDDAWHPDKLASLQEELDKGIQLVYSDCRVVDAAGEVLSETFWTRKANQWTDFERLVLSNTVSGSAAAFRKDLLGAALPFPRLPGEKLYHDHWLALVALGRGPIAYIDRPLYDYVQHPGADTGHYDGPARAPRREARTEPSEERVARTQALVARERSRTVLLLETLLARRALRGPRVLEAKRLLAADRNPLTQLVWLLGKSLRSGRPGGIGWNLLLRRAWSRLDAG